MTRRALFVIALFILSLFGSLVTGRELLYSLTYFLGGLIFISFIWAKTTLRGIELERYRRSNRAQVGQIFMERFRLRNRSRIPKLWTEASDSSELPGYKIAGVTSRMNMGLREDEAAHRAVNVTVGIGSGQIRTWLVRTLCTRRGQYRLGPLTIRSADPFGIFPQEMSISSDQNLVVLPMTVQIPEFPLPSGRLPGGESLRRRTHQITPNASGVREYVPGDSLSRIHWPSTARRRRLIVKEFELDPLAEIWIVLDAAREVQRKLSDEPEREGDGFLDGFQFKLPPSTEEYSISAAASLALHFLQLDRAVGLIAYGNSRLVMQPETGESQRYRLMESLAVFESTGELTIEEVLKVEGPQIPRGSTVIVITPSLDTTMLGAVRRLSYTGCQPVLVQHDLESFGGAPGTHAIAGAAERSGIPVRIMRKGEPLDVSLGTSGMRGKIRVAA